MIDSSIFLLYYLNANFFIIQGSQLKWVKRSIESSRRQSG